MIFKKINLNPRGKRSGDCVVRAIMQATNQTWDKVYKDLCQIGFELKAMPSEKAVYALYLDKLSWRKNKMPRFKDNTRYTVKEFAHEFKKGTYIINVAHHITTIEDGVLIDTWDCSYKSVGNYWSKD